MKSAYINPFIEATVVTFKTMLGTTPKRNGELRVKAGVFDVGQIVGVIGLTGTVKGAVMISMNPETAMKSVGAFLGEEITEVNADVMDGIAELLNIIAGAAAAKLEGQQVNLALPTVLTGTEQKMTGNESSPWIIIPMVTDDWGEFNIEVTMEEA